MREKAAEEPAARRIQLNIRERAVIVERCWRRSVVGVAHSLRHLRPEGDS